MRGFLALFGTSVFLMTACGRPVAQDSTTKALVSEQQAEEAFKIVQSIDYIPFTYIVDGCYARSLYMSMELAAKGIPSSAHYIYGNLNPTAEVSWWYHVAPLLKIEGDEAEPWILDPAFEKEPLRRSEWIAKNNSSGNYRTELKAGSAYFDESGRTSEFNDDRMIQNFEEMPTFLTSDIGAACTTMYSYLRNTAKTSAQLTAVRKKLISQTALLSTALQAEGKLEFSGYSSDVNSACKTAIGSAL